MASALVGHRDDDPRRGLEPDGVHLRAEWPNGGEAWLELEDRNVLAGDLLHLGQRPAPMTGTASRAGS